MRWKYTFRVVGALLAVLPLNEACSSRRRSTAPVRVEAPAAHRVSSGANIVIVPSPGEAGRLPTLRFCFEGDKNHDPQIWRVHLGPVSGQKGGCEILGTGDAWLWDEWKIGSVPPGFRMVGCDVLSPGQYEVYVDARLGSGVMRMEIGVDGTARRIPWDDLDNMSGKDCPPTRRQQPSVFPNPEALPEEDTGLVPAQDLESLRVKRLRYDGGA
jgi:hypothetical protein